MPKEDYSKRRAQVDARVLAVALAALEDPSGIDVLRDVVLETRWYDARVMPLTRGWRAGSAHRMDRSLFEAISEGRAFTPIRERFRNFIHDEYTLCHEPHRYGIEDWARAIAAVLMFKGFEPRKVRTEHPWRVAQVCERLKFYDPRNVEVRIGRWTATEPARRKTTND